MQLDNASRSRVRTNTVCLEPPLMNSMELDERSSSLSATFKLHKQ